MNTIKLSRKKALNFLNISVSIWFLVAVFGIWFFAYYILSIYGSSAIQGNFKSWNNILRHGYVSGETMGNIAIITHLLLAIIMNVGGPIQFIQQIRNRFPVFHKWNGRVFLSTAVLMSFSGLYLSFSGRVLGGPVTDKIPLGISAILAIIFAILTLRTAIARNFKMHYRWALRLFIAVSSVFFSRIGFMLWLFIKGEGTINFEMEGSFTTFLDLAVDSAIFPLIILELYLRSKRSENINSKYAMAILLLVFAIAMSIGIFAAIKGMWLPLM